MIFGLIFFILPNPSLAAFKKGTASVDKHWVASGSTNDFTFDYTNPGNSDTAKCIIMNRPTAQFTITDG